HWWALFGPLQVAPGARGMCTGVPLPQESWVHALPSFSTSLSSLMVVASPPSHTARLQSPVVWVPSGVPFGAVWTPHITFGLQTGSCHSFGFGQSLSMMQPTQTPLPLHIRFGPHEA